MNSTQAENLRILIRYMESVPVTNLYMPRRKHPCGTPACAMGHAQQMPELIARGIPKEGLDDVAVSFFGLGEDVRRGWGRLFGSILVTPGDGFNLRPTPHEWAAEARKVLAEHGYSFDDPKPAPFAAFMAKALEPVALEA